MSEIEKSKILQEIVQVSCIEKSFEEYDYHEFITYKFVIQNKSEKTIRAIKGGITFANIFDEEIRILKLVYDQSIKPGNRVVYDATTDFNQFNDEDRELRSKALKDLKVIWEPEKVIFEGGSLLE